MKLVEYQQSTEAGELRLALAADDDGNGNDDGVVAAN